MIKFVINENNDSQKINKSNFETIMRVLGLIIMKTMSQSTKSGPVFF